MFDDIPKVQRERMIICVVIFYLLLVVAYCISLCFLYKNINVNILVASISLFIFYLIYRIVKYWKKNLTKIEDK